MTGLKWHQVWWSVTGTHSSTSIESSTILLGRKPLLFAHLLLKSKEYFTKELQDEEIEEIENTDFIEVLQRLNYVKEGVYDNGFENISLSQVRMRKHYDIRHSHNFAFRKRNKVLKLLLKMYSNRAEGWMINLLVHTS